MALSADWSVSNSTSGPDQRLHESVERAQFVGNWALLLLLATIQFAHVLDFVIVMPLGPQFMRVFDIGPRGFGLFVSAYQLSAAFATLAGAVFLDRFGRKQALLFIFAGFMIGTLACAFAFGPATLLCARIVTGAFGGLIQALLFAIVGDAFPERKRGAAMGTVMTAFSLASVLGVPVALALASRFDWRAPFFMLAAISLVAWLFAYLLLPPMRDHLHHRVAGAESSAVARAVRILRNRNTYAAFGVTTSLMFAGFMVIPFMSSYLVSNVGLHESDLATVFLCGGIASIFTCRLSGRLADHFGKSRVFTWLALGSMVPVLALTSLSHAPLALVLFVTTSFTVLISARAVPALALITSSTCSEQRGSFMSLTSSVQQAASGLASLFAGFLLGRADDGAMTHYNLVGYIAVGATFVAIFASRHLGRCTGASSVVKTSLSNDLTPAAPKPAAPSYDGSASPLST